MQNSTRTWIVVAIVIIAILAGIALFLNKPGTPAPAGESAATSTSSAATSTSGTATNTTPAASLGGAVTQTQIDQQYATLQRGQDKKNAGDYRGAATIWEGLAESNSFISYIAYNNLADMYENIFHNYPAAEVNYMKVVSLKPDYIDGYRNLYMLYTAYGYKAGTSAAADILAQGLKANPGNHDLLYLQTQLGAKSN